ncbi:uncharacterized protein LOC125536416 [Triticum urartu]|uniref:uncharacterized protein LOC125536416 n=1 Tax=Triticum urartu TaxID=4572 RepID=UPI00204470EF|nr:uncharacterized protein LOC125536416 [Triticum urartu]
MMRLNVRTRGSGGLSKLTNYIALYYILTNWLLRRLMEGSSDQRSQIGCFKFLVLELISSTQTCIRKPTDSQSRKAWILSCSDNNNLGVACKKTIIQVLNQVNCRLARTSVEHVNLCVGMSENVNHVRDEFLEKVLETRCCCCCS